MNAELHIQSRRSLQVSGCGEQLLPSLNTVTVPPVFAAKTPGHIQADLVGFPPTCVGAALRFRERGESDALIAMLPGMIEFHLPAGTGKPPAVLADDLRLNQDLGLDSLALTEMAFKMDDLFGIPIETHEMAGIETVGDLRSFVLRKFIQA